MSLEKAFKEYKNVQLKGWVKRQHPLCDWAPKEGPRYWEISWEIDKPILGEGMIKARDSLFVSSHAHTMLELFNMVVSRGMLWPGSDGNWDLSGGLDTLSVDCGALECWLYDYSHIGIYAEVVIILTPQGKYKASTYPKFGRRKKGPTAVGDSLEEVLQNLCEKIN